MAHGKMLAFKEEHNMRVNLSFEKLQEQLRVCNEGYLLEKSDEITAFRHLQEISDKFPLWPFNTMVLIRFVSTITIPLLIFIVQLVVSRDSILWDPNYGTYFMELLRAFFGIKI
jgi:hypothetical protein